MPTCHARTIFRDVEPKELIHADIIKVPFTGNPEGFRDIIATSSVPVVAAGGPKTKTLEDAVEMLKQVMASGARGATVGRNVWGYAEPLKALRAMQAVVHGNAQEKIT